MTVKELIKELQTMPQDAEVVDGYEQEIKVVWHDAEHDSDVHVE